MSFQSKSDPHRIGIIGNGLAGRTLETDLLSKALETPTQLEVSVTTIAPNISTDRQPIFEGSISGEFSPLLRLNSSMEHTEFPSIPGIVDYPTWAVDRGIDVSRGAFPERSTVGQWIREQQEQVRGRVCDQGIPLHVEDQISGVAISIQPTPARQYIVEWRNDAGSVEAEVFDQVGLAVGHVFSPNFPSSSASERMIIGVPSGDKLGALKPIIENASTVLIAGGKSSSVDTINLLEAVGFGGTYVMVAPNGPIVNWIHEGMPEVHQVVSAHCRVFDLIRSGRVQFVEGRLSDSQVEIDRANGKFVSLIELPGGIDFVNADIFCDCAGPCDSLFTKTSEQFPLVVPKRPGTSYVHALARSLIEDLHVPLSMQGQLDCDDSRSLGMKGLFAVGPLVHRGIPTLMAQIGDDANRAASRMISNIKDAERKLTGVGS